MIYTPPTEKPEPGRAYLENTHFIDCASTAVVDFARRAIGNETSELGKATKLFYAVRDGLRYDPFAMRLDPMQYIASNVIAAKAAYCIPKAILLTAAARAAGIQAAIGLSDVVNHLTTEKLRERMGGKTYFLYHGYAVLYLAGQWIKAAPAFNIELCRRFGVRPTEFDGRSDAIFQPFDESNRRHMEYVKDHGCWSEFPYKRVMKDFREFYPPATYGEAQPSESFEDGVPVR